MFKPGSHTCDVYVGYYTQVLGLGAAPTDTLISGLYSPDSCGKATLNFWKSVENVELGHSQTEVMWYVSQGCPMRRTNIVGDIRFGSGWSSGGYMANSKVSGRTYAGSQQQWYNRNVEMEGGF